MELECVEVNTRDTLKGKETPEAGSMNSEQFILQNLILSRFSLKIKRNLVSSIKQEEERNDRKINMFRHRFRKRQIRPAWDGDGHGNFSILEAIRFVAFDDLWSYGAAPVWLDSEKGTQLQLGLKPRPSPP